MGRGGPGSRGPPSRDNADSAGDCPASEGERPGTGLFEAPKPTLPGRLCACWGPGEPAVLSWIGMEGISPYLKIRKLKKQNKNRP